MTSKAGVGLVILFVFLLLASLSQALSENDPKFNFNEEATNPAKTGEIFKYSPPTPPKYEFNLLGLLLKTTLALGIITVAIYFILKVFFRGRGLAYSKEGLFRVIGNHALAPNRYIQLIEIGNILLLLGITENGIRLLTEIKDGETIDLIKTQASRIQPVEGISFSHHLMEFLKGFGRKDLDEVLTRENKVTFLKEQRDKLRRLK